MVTPSDANDPGVVWSSSDTSVATVDANGLLTAVAEGSATITVTTNDGGFTENCVVNSTAETSTNIETKPELNNIMIKVYTLSGL